MIVSIIIPCFNEEKTIKKLIEQSFNLYPNYQVYAYDNLSNDNTKNEILQTKAIYRSCLKPGKGNVIKQAFNEIVSDIYVVLDGDLTYDLRDLKKMIFLQQKNNLDVIIGKRIKFTKENKKILHFIGNKCITFLFNILYNTQYQDILSGYRVFNKKAVQLMNLTQNEFEIETEMNIEIKQKNLKFQEIPILYHKRIEESYSKLNTFKDGFKIIKFFIFKKFNF